jgi:hypothetical protein
MGVLFILTGESGLLVPKYVELFLQKYILSYMYYAFPIEIAIALYHLMPHFSLAFTCEMKQIHFFLIIMWFIVPI